MAGDAERGGGRARPAPRGAPRPDARDAGAPGPRAAEAEVGLVQAGALADRTRFRLHRCLLAADGPMSVADLTRVVGVHHTAVRAHLSRLVDAGLVVEEVAPPSGRGRPPRLYRAAAAVPAMDEPAAYQRLAALLARVVRTGETPREVGRDAGRSAARRARAADPSADGTEVLVAQAERLGFRPELVDDGRGLALRNCPFSDVAAEDPATVCAVHLGLAEGIAEELGGVSVTGLHVQDPHRAGCRIDLAASGDDGGSTG